MPADALVTESLLQRIVGDGKPYFGPHDDSILQSCLYESIGQPAGSEIVLLPLRTRQRTAAVIYGDFGTAHTHALQTESLEILADFAGMAFDLALSDKQHDSGRLAPLETPAAIATSVRESSPMKREGVVA